MADDNKKPTVTFYVMAYNQSRFVRQAVEGALGQTYGPMEILLSDDCSTDDTFDIIQDAVKGYSGPHTIVLNRNERNLGVSRHLNRMMELATGELIIASDGDDVSYPHRTERCVEAWLKYGKPAALASSVSCIDDTGRPSTFQSGEQFFAQFLPAQNETRDDCLVRFAKHGSPRLVSCSGAWTREMHQAFGPLSPGIWFEDDVITLRAWLFDRIVFIHEPLVNYREHDANIFNRIPRALNTTDARQDAERATRTEAQRRRECLWSYLTDLDLALRRGWVTQAMHDELKRRFKTQSVFHQVIEDWWDLDWFMRFGFFLFLFGLGRLREGVWCSTRLLPFSVFIKVAAAWSRRPAWTKTVLADDSYLKTMVLLSLAGPVW